MELEWHLGEAHARWLRDLVAKDKANRAEAAREGAKGRARPEWQEEVTRLATALWRDEPGLSASSIAEVLAARGVLRKYERSPSTVRQYLARKKKSAAN
jgi:hypothetical protein